VQLSLQPDYARCAQPAASRRVAFHWRVLHMCSTIDRDLSTPRGGHRVVNASASPMAGERLGWTSRARPASHERESATRRYQGDTRAVV